MSSLALTIHQADYFKPAFVFQKVVQQLKFVVSSFPMDSGLLSEPPPCQSWLFQKHSGDHTRRWQQSVVGVGLAIGASWGAQGPGREIDLRPT